MANGEKVGVIRVVDKKDGSRKRISPIWIIPECRNKGYAQQAIIAVERKYGANYWCFDTLVLRSRSKSDIQPAQAAISQKG